MPRYMLAVVNAAQNALLAAGLLLVATLPPILAFAPAVLPAATAAWLYALSLACVTVTMAVRPLADFAPALKPYVTLRKGFGVLSASAIVVFLIAKLLADPIGYIASVGTAAYWSLGGYALLAHLGDLAAVPLLLTSNKFSRRTMGPWWKRVQKLAYVYFYAGVGYEALALGSVAAWLSLVAVTALVAGAWLYKKDAQQPKPSLSRA